MNGDGWNEYGDAGVLVRGICSHAQPTSPVRNPAKPLTVRLALKVVALEVRSRELRARDAVVLEV